MPAVKSTIPLTVLEVLARAIGQETEITGKRIRKEEENCPCIIRDDAILKSSKSFTETVGEAKNKFHKDAGYEINTQKSIANNKLAEKEI